MVGFSGVLGEHTDVPVETVPPTVGGERTDFHRDEGIVVRAASHAGTTGPQPAEGPDGTLVWVFGEVFSVTHGGERRSVDPARTAEVCAAQHAAHGPDFVEALDGEFAGLLYDPRNGTATLFTDRVGARPLYYAIGDHTLAFSTSVQTVPDIPGHEPAFAESYLAEYLSFRRTQGTKTPIAGVEQVAPATLLTYGTDAAQVDRRQYWQPRYEPTDKPLSYFVAELADRFERAVADRMPRADGEYGLLLSGGSDSRTVLAAADSPPDCYHMGDGPNREARYAERAAEAAGARFERLDRGIDYHETLLKRAAPIQEFIGPFQSGHMLGYAETLAETDALFTGLYCDVLFGSWSVPQKELDLPFGVTLWPPVADVPSTTAGHVERLATSAPTRTPPFLRADPLADVLADNIHRDGNTVVDHGVTYPSVADLSLSTFLYPVTNGIGYDLFAAAQIAPTRTPLLDRRLLELHLEMPVEYRLRHEPVHRAMERLDPSLAAVRNASSAVPVRSPKAAHVVGNRLTNQTAKLRGSPSFRTTGPLQNKDEVIRESDFLGQALERNAERGRALSCVDWEEVEETYRRHRAREINVGEELYRLVSVLESSVGKRILG